MDLLGFVANIVSSAAWPVAIVCAVILLRIPLAALLGRIEEIEVKGVKMRLSKIEIALDDYELLKANMDVALAGKKIGEEDIGKIEEIRALLEFAQSLQSSLLQPDRNTVERWLRKAHDLAMRDGHVSPDEREAIIRIATSRDWNKVDVVALLDQWDPGNIDRNESGKH